MAQPRWKSLDAFVAELGPANDAKLRQMPDWAEHREHSADAPGMGRNPRGRRQFTQMREAAERELDRRGLLWPET